ncbi:MAG: pilus assembly protein TadG-related protein [Acidobacteriota bacterium]|nr:pilus assembly protein TadG-related protein [Acidobacteriota bacterium]
MDTRNRNSLRGAVALQLLVILVPVLFGFMGFAIDLGRLYLIRGELNQAANAMALSAARQLIGTNASTDYATNAARLTLDNSNGNANRYNFGSLPIGDSSGFFQSNVPDPGYFATAADAVTSDPNSPSGSASDGATAQYVQTNITADAPLTFWALLPGGASRKTTIAARAVAGISAPLCTACGIENFAVAALDSSDTVNFGFTSATRYTFGYVCTGTPQPAALAGTAQRLPYLLLDRYDTASTFDETQQLFRIGSAGLPGSGIRTQACFTANNTEVVWATALPQSCASQSVTQSVRFLLCGVSTRMDSNTPATCNGITGLAGISSAYAVDTDLTGIDDYTTYTGSIRRVITIPIVDALSAAGAMTILGFRQFLLEATQGGAANDPADTDGRFQALYIGSPVPLKQGRFDGGCQAQNGPGKVVLFQ